MQTSECSICTLHKRQKAREKWEIFRNDLWLLRHHPDPAPIAGWLLLDSRRHLGGPVDFNESEASSWGLIVQQASELTRKITNCDRIYAIAFGEGAQHLHLHLIPRFATDYSTEAWAVADHYRSVIHGETKAVNSYKVTALVEEARTLWK